MSQEKQSELENKVAELESKVAFQEITISDLNQELSLQQEKLERMHLQLKLLFRQMQDMKGSNIASEGEETPPPHY